MRLVIAILLFCNTCLCQITPTSVIELDSVGGYSLSTSERQLNRYVIEGDSVKFWFKLGFNPKSDSVFTFVGGGGLGKIEFNFNSTNYSDSQRVLIPLFDDAIDTTGIKVEKVRLFRGGVRNKLNTRLFDFSVRTFDELYSAAVLDTIVSDQFSSLSPDVLRDTLIRRVWRDSLQLPHRMPDNIQYDYSSSVYFTHNTLYPIDSVIRYHIEVGDFDSYVYHAIPQNPSSPVKLAIVHSGHETGFGNELKHDVAVQQFVQRGWHVLFSYMPLFGENTHTSYTSHSNIGSNEGSFVNSSLAAYFEPAIIAKNYVFENWNVDMDNVIMIGISGGGYTTHWLTAMDTTIKKSFAFSGSQPRWTGNNSGDYEQNGNASGGWLRHVYDNVADFQDLYVLSSHPNRTHYQVLNITDDCCFEGKYYQAYEEEVKSMALGYGGTFDVIPYYNVIHDYNLKILLWVISNL